MGKLEKLIVLTVLFAAAVILAVSLHRGKDEVETSDPLSGARGLLGTESSTLDPVVPAPADPFVTPPQPSQPAETEARATSLLLHAGAESSPAAPPASTSVAGLTSSLRVEPESDPDRPILLDRQDLRPSFMDEYMLYTVVEGDTWSSLAQRFYQDGSFTRNLHLANEDLSELVPGKDILVPVYDLLALDAGTVDTSTVEANPSESATGREVAFAAPVDQPPAQPAGTRSPASAPAGGLVYTVRAGDTLSEISLAALGSATRWKELLELNQGVLQKPEDLRVGMKLQLPAGARVPSVVKPEGTKPPSKPKAKTAQADPAGESAPATSTKKRKVL